MTRNRISVLAGAAVLAAAGPGTGVAIAAASPSGPHYSWYRSMMSGYHGGQGMMGGSSCGRLMSRAGYQRVTGGTGAPGSYR